MSLDTCQECLMNGVGRLWHLWQCAHHLLIAQGHRVCESASSAFRDTEASLPRDCRCIHCDRFQGLLPGACRNRP